MCIQVPEIAIKPRGTELEAVGNYHLQEERIASDARDAVKP
jgi:hypothetical protein